MSDLIGITFHSSSPLVGEGGLLNSRPGWGEANRDASPHLYPPPQEGRELGTTGLTNSRLGMMLLIGSETVLFTSFIGAYLVLRFGALRWPPFGTPVLGLGLSSANTALLVGTSALTLFLRRWARLGQRDALRKGVQAFLALGGIFLAAQAFEFQRLYAQGLTLKSGTYGALFYSLITCHGLHVLGGLVIFSVLWSKISSDGTAALQQRVGDAALYWHFVTGVWLVLFGILYLW